MEYCTLFTALFGTNSRPDLEQHQVAVPVVIERGNSKIEMKDKYKEDIEALARHFGGIQSKTGLCITLQEILTICPRERKRSDAYNGLVSYLLEQYGVKLVIQSRKHGRKD
jgi:hypothetical protein